MKNSQITETDIWAYVSEQSDQDIIEKVERWINSDEYDDLLFQEIKEMHNLTGQNPYQEPVDTNRAKQSFFDVLEAAAEEEEEEEEDTSPKYNWKGLLKYAAIFALLISSVAYVFILNDNTVTIETAYSEHKQINLPDGSTVWLNSSSKLIYDEDSPRTLYLEGEGFFDVAKNKKVPFTVDTPDHIRVKALGTSFNVKAYKQNNFTETVLLTGKVEVSSDTHFDKKVNMIPNEKVTFTQHNKQITKEKVAYMNSVISWRNGKIQFRNKSFKDIASDLNIQQNVSIRFNNEEVSNYKFTGTFEKNTPVSEILEVLKSTKHFVYETISENEFLIQ